MARSDADRFSSVNDEPIKLIADMGDVAKVKAVILSEYGFEPTEEYCRDLIRFVESMTSTLFCESVKPTGAKGGA
jgi:hypothetical protein